MKFERLRGGPAARAIFWVVLVFAFVMAILPNPPPVPGQPNDKLQHIAAFATLTLLATIAYPRASLLKLLASLSAFGALIEFVQAIPALHRDSDVLDWIADTVAVIVVMLLIQWWRFRR